jgi:hypothetical protein
MFSFGQRKVIKQCGSRIINSTNPEMKAVIIEMDSENRLGIAADDTPQDTADCYLYAQEVNTNERSKTRDRS